MLGDLYLSLFGPQLHLCRGMLSTAVEVCLRDPSDLTHAAHCLKMARIAY